jgi:uncharacterized membrane protein YbhN (UPF0104 family)
MNEGKVIDIQLYAVGISVITTIISLLLTYNQKLEKQNKKTLFTPKQTLKITKINRITILIVTLTFLYVNYRLYQISKKEGENLTPYKLQITSSILVTIAGIITLYVILQSEKETVADVENPIV